MVGCYKSVSRFRGSKIEDKPSNFVIGGNTRLHCDNSEYRAGRGECAIRPVEVQS